MIPKLPLFFQKLYTGENEISKFFPNIIRKFNSGLAMASTKVDKDATTSNVHGGIASYRIQGCLYRYIGALRNNNGENPRCLQTYFYTAEEQATIRTMSHVESNAKEKEKSMVHKLFFNLHQQLLQCKNKYLTSFLSVNEVIKKLDVKPEEVKICLHADKCPDGEHIKRYNLPLCSEVSILMPNEVGMDEKRQVVCSVRNQNDLNPLKVINDEHKAYDPLAYPMFLPKGTDGWNYEVNHPVTLNQWLSYMMCKRDNFNVLHHGNKLFQQWLVDQFCKMENLRMKFIRKNQKNR